jgi:hypothetical protein
MSSIVGPNISRVLVKRASPIAPRSIFFRSGGEVTCSRFIELARSVYETNDRRAAVKRRINERLDSEIIEEKSYSASDQRVGDGSGGAPGLPV